MDSYASEAKFLESLPVPVFHATLQGLMVHCGQFTGREKLFHLAQNLLQNIGEYHGPQYESFVKKCAECLRRLPDPEGHIKDYANHVERCCLS
jgi:homogentisate 1,2-dioxygenase